MFSLEIKGLQNLNAGLASLPAALLIAQRTAMEASTKLVEADAKANVPRRTGDLAASIHSQVGSFGVGLDGSVGTDSTYGWFVEQGTGPHEIAPVTAQALLTDIGVFARVQHPGTSPAPYLAPALNNNRVQILEILRASFQAALSLVRGV